MGPVSSRARDKLFALWATLIYDGATANGGVMQEEKAVTKQSRYQRKNGFLRRNWIVLTLAVPSFLILLAAFGWWWWLPTLLERAVVDMENSAGHILTAEVTHEGVTLEGMDRLHIEGLRVGSADSPLCRIELLVVDFDPLAFTEGLPTVLQLTGTGVELAAARAADGSDNITPLLKSLLAYLNRDRSGTGDASRLARLLRQTPIVQLDGLALSLSVEGEGGQVDKVVRLTEGSLRAENPNISLRNRAYQIDGSFQQANGRSRLTFKADVDIDKRSAQFQADFSPGMYLAWGGQELEVEQFRFRTGEFVELTLGRTALLNPLEDPAFLQAGLTRLGSSPQLLGIAANSSARVAGLRQKLEKLVATVEPKLVSAGYPQGLLARFARSCTRFGTQLMQRLLSEAEGDHLVLDSARIVYLVSPTRTGAPQEKLKVFVKAGGSGGGELSVTHRPDDDFYSATFDLVSPSRLFQVSGEFEKEGESTTLRADVSANLLDPFFQAKGSVTYGDGGFSGDFRAQLKAEEPPLALSADVALRNGEMSGTVDGELLVPGLAHVSHGKISFERAGWEADLEGSAYPPDGSSPVNLQLSLSSEAGIRRIVATCDGDVRLPLDDYDVLLGKSRMGRDAVIHLEDVALVRQGADRSRAVVRVADLAIHLTHRGKELLESLAGLDMDGSIEALLGRLISSVEVVQPTIELRQPPSIAIAGDEHEQDTADDLADKIDDALEEGGGEAVVMYEPYRHALEAVVVSTATGVRGLLRAMLRVGDRFPLDKVEIKDGRFEYSDAVLERDRLITELSNFNASIRKVKRAGNLGGKFSFNADFSTAVANARAGSSLTAEVDLATGDLKGRFQVEKMALHPYRFLLPSLVQAHQKTFLEDAVLGFAYTTETDRFRVWGHGRLSDFNIISPRIARKALDHLSLDFGVGDDESNGLIFELERRRVATNSPIFLGFGKLKGVSATFAMEATVPDYPKFELVIRIPEVPVDDLLASIPKALGDKLAGMQVGGRLGLTLTMEADSRNLRSMVFNVAATEERVKLEVPGREVDFNMLAGPFKHRPPTDRDRVIMVGGGGDFVPLSRISPWLVLAVTTTEDGSFFRHEGFNTYQAKMSVIRNLEKGRFVRGASTISMQLVKNLFLSHEKTMARKFQEIILTWLIEREIEKEKLIEVYLNVIEWGDGVYGIKEACDYYFNGLPAEYLSPAQSAFLASFIPYPRPFQKRFAQGMGGKERSKSWLRWWSRRQKLVKRIVRAMVNNCHNVSSKCPASKEYCRIMAATCRDPGRELIAADNVTDLDEIFRPRDIPEIDPVLDLGSQEEL